MDEQQRTENTAGTAGVDKHGKPIRHFPMWKRILIFVLGIFVGLVACLGTIAGVGFWAYKNLQIGSVVTLPEGLQGSGEQNLSEYTLSMLVDDVMYYSANQDKLTLGGLQERYGLKMLTDLSGQLPTGVMDIPLSTLGTEEGTDSLLSAIDLAYLLSFAGEDAVSPALKDALGDKTLKQLTGDDLTAVFAGVKLGYLLGYDYEQQADGSWVLVPGADMDAMMETLADVELSSLLDGDMDLHAVLGDTTLGDLLGYRLVDDVWYNGEAPLTRLEKSLAGEKVTDLMDNGFDISVLDDTYLGELMNYTRQGDGWANADGKKITGMYDALASLTVKDITAEDFDINSVIGNIYLGELMGFTPVYKADGETVDYWKDANGVKVEGMNASVASLRAGTLTDGDFDFQDAFGHQKLGELQEYTYKNGKWYNGSTPLGPLDNAIADLVVGDLIDGNVDLADKLDDVYVGEVLGYTGSKGAWMNGKVRVTGLNAIVADLLVGDMENNDKLTSCLSKATVAEMLGLKQVSGTWYDGGKKASTFLALLAPVQVGELSGTVDSWYLGNLMGYTGTAGAWKNGGTAVKGLMNHLADLRLSEIGEESSVRAVMDNIRIGDVVGYTEKADGWYAGTAKVTGIMGAVAGSTVGTLDARVQALTLREIYDNTDTGFLSIVGGDTRVQDLGTRMNALFDSSTGASVGEFVDAGLIKVTDAQRVKLEVLIPGWSAMPITGFVEKLIDTITR